MAAVIAFLSDPAHLSALFALLFALSEVIGWIPSVKASGVFQAIVNGLGALKKVLLPPAQ